MDPSEVAMSYDSLALHWASPEFNQANGIAQHHRALQFVRHRRNAIDIGCGSNGRLIELLRAEGFVVEGLDRSQEMLRLAQIKHPQVAFHLADVSLWKPSRMYDFITAWDSIWHIPLTSQAEVLAKLCSALAPQGVLIFTAGGLDQEDEVHNEMMGVPMYHATLGIPEIFRVLIESDCICRHFEYDQWPERHTYMIGQKLG